ncbi:MAG: hypothetical protein ACLQVX_00245 [Limisphaerales bacterium]|jgi:hypothetical protein
MNPSFVPFSLSARAAAPAAAQTKLDAEPPPSRSFRPMASAAASTPQVLAAGAEPIVTLERDGSRITHIKIQCCCGHVIELACES